MLRLVLTCLLLTAPVLADSITIGTLTYLGPNAQGFSQYQVVLDTNGVTAAPLTFTYGIGTDAGGGIFGPITTNGPTTLLILGGPAQGIPGCPCGSITFIVIFGNGINLPFTFLLANGQSFTALPGTASTILPLAGQSLVQPGQSTPILIKTAPEPATALLFGTGLICFAARWKATRRR